MDNHIVVVGAGFVGSILVEEYLRRAYAGVLPRGIHVIDADAWEPRNAANQNVSLHTAKEHANKADTLAETVRNFGLQGQSTVTYVTEENVEELISGAKFIVDAVDNLATRQLLYTHGLAHKIPVLHIGISEQGSGTVEWSHPDHDRFHLSPIKLAGKTVEDPASGVTPPCQLARMRGCGLNIGFAGAMSLAMVQGFDPEVHIPEGSFGWLTEWKASPTAHMPVTESWEYVESL